MSYNRLNGYIMLVRCCSRAVHKLELRQCKIFKFGTISI